MKDIECPRCKKNTYCFDAEQSRYPALSRRDNKTNICGFCGTDEALFDWRMSQLKVAYDDVRIKEERKWLDEI